MGRATLPPARPTYEELEAVIQRKNEAVRNSYWNSHSLWSIAWLAYQAHDSGNHDFDNETYAEASAHAMKHIAEWAKVLHEELEEEHARAGIAIATEAGAAS